MQSGQGEEIHVWKRIYPHLVEQAAFHRMGAPKARPQL
jgi:hypothetical protein